MPLPGPVGVGGFRESRPRERPGGRGSAEAVSTRRSSSGAGERCCAGAREPSHIVGEQREVVDAWPRNHGCSATDRRGQVAPPEPNRRSSGSGRTRPRIVERAKALGYEVDAVFIGTRTAEINVERVAARVTSRTGHGVETTEIHRRWRAAQDNLARTAGSFSRIALWDNSGGTTRRVGHIDATDIPALAKPTPE